MRLVFDIEGNGLYDTVTKLWCICLKDIDTGETYEWKRQGRPSSANSVDQVLSLLSEADELVGHNIINFDLPVLEKMMGWRPSANTKITDTLVMSRLFNPDRPRPHNYNGKGGPHSLEAWGYRVGRGKPDHQEWSVFSSAMLHRCREDVEINALTLTFLQQESLGWDWNESLRLERATAYTITWQEHRGISFDVGMAIEYVHWLNGKVQSIDRDIIPRLPKEIKVIGTTVTKPFLKTGGYRKQTRDYLDEAYRDRHHEGLVSGPFSRIRFLNFKLSSTERVKQYLMENGWIPENWNYSKKTGERTSPKLEGDFRGVDGEIPRRVKERIVWSHRRNQIEGWLKRVRTDNTLPAGANPCGTNTGRMRHTVVVNIPKANADKQGNLIWDTDEQKDIFGTQMRSLFIPREGYRLVGHDASGLELRMLAHYMNDPDFTKEILDGDIHEFNRRKAGLPDRNSAKTFIYAFLYGAGDGKIGSIIQGTADDGKSIKLEFLGSLPILDRLIKSVKRASGKGFLRGLDGRKIWMRRDASGRIQRSKALNTLLQCAGAVVMKQSSVYLWEAVEREGLRAYKVLDMHDECQAEVHPDDVDRYCELAVNSIVQAGEYFNLNIPLAAEAKVGNNMAETH